MRYRRLGLLCYQGEIMTKCTHCHKTNCTAIDDGDWMHLETFTRYSTTWTIFFAEDVGWVTGSIDRNNKWHGLGTYPTRKAAYEYVENTRPSHDKYGWAITY